MSEEITFWRELYRRRVLRTTAAYAVLAFVLVQLVAGLSSYYGWPHGLVLGCIWVAVLGAVPVVLVSWLYDWTPWGIFKTSRHFDTPQRKTGLIDYRVEAVIIFVLLIALGIAIRQTFDEFAEARARAPEPNQAEQSLSR